MKPRTTKAVRQGRISVITLFLAALLVAAAALLLLGKDYEKSLLRADCLFLSGYLEAWQKAGRPEGQAFIQFQQGKPPEIQISNRVFHLNGVTYNTQFASTNLRGGIAGVLYITEKRILLLERSPGGVTLVNPLK
jgi:hypothetical protein